jgi:hypothetical protein
MHLRRDLNSLAMRKLIREEMWDTLRHLGVVPATSQPPPLPSSKSRPALSVVPTDDDGDAP